MPLTQKTIDDVVNDAVRGAVNIPEFQRGFVWRSDQVRDLIESLHRDYPVGAMLVWDSSEYDIPRVAQGAQTTHWIVDGQQRATALCIAFGSKPYWWPDAESWNQVINRVDVLANLQSNDGHLEFALANPIRKHDKNWLSVRRVLRCEKAEEVSTLALAVADEREGPPGSDVFAKTFSVINGLWNIRKRTIPLVSVQHDVEDVAEIFARLNQAGTHVTEADVVVALVAASNPEWVRDEFLSYSKDLADVGYDLEPGVYIRTITGVERGTARLKDVRADFWKHDIQRVWEQVKGSITQTVKLLCDRGVLCAQIRPSRNSLIPLFVFWARFGQSIAFDRVFHWFLLANADGRYSGSSVTSLTQDLSAIRNAPDGKSALESLTKELRISTSVDGARFIEDYSRDRFGRLLLYLLLFDRQAIDWVSKVRIGYQKEISALSEGFLPEWHHIFPRAALRKAKVSEDDWNLLANITVLNEATNRNRLRSKIPQQYVDEFHIASHELNEHMIPHTAPLTVEGYHTFLTDRAEMLAETANTYLKGLREG